MRTSTSVQTPVAAFRGWLSKPRSAFFWRLSLSGLFLCWWQFLATYMLLGRGPHPYWWAYLDDLASLANDSWQVVTVLAIALVTALLGPWALPAASLSPVGGWRSWVTIGVLVGLVPQLWMAAIWLTAPVLEPVGTSVAGRPTRPMLWIIAESADVGLHLARVDARHHDYYGIIHSLSVPSGRVAGVWAQICGDQLDARHSEARHRCLVDDGWRIIHGRPDAWRLDALLASTGADVIGGDHFRPDYERGRQSVPDAALLQKALEPDKMKHHVLVLTGDTTPPVHARAVATSDAAMDAALGEWLDRGGIALVTANRPRPRDGWHGLPARLYGVRDLALPPGRDIGLQLGKSAPGRLMGGLPYGSLYDAGCTAWELAGFGCSSVGHGISLTRETSTTLGLFRSAR